MDNNELVTEALRLTLLCLHGDASEDEQDRLGVLLAESEAARLVYLYAADDTVTLTDTSISHGLRADGLTRFEASDQKLFELVSPHSNGPQISYRMLRRSPFSERQTHPPKRSNRFRMSKRNQFYGGAALAGLALVAAIFAFMSELTTHRKTVDRKAQLAQSTSRSVPVVGEPSRLDSRPAGVVGASPFSGRIIDLANVEWAAGMPRYEAWSRISIGDQLQFDAGVVEMMLDNGAQIVLQGPADFRLVTPLKVVVRRGKLVMRCGPDAVGFEVESPDANVVDLGTAFGISIVDGASTDVIVYEGAVDLSVRASTEQRERRLTAGEALHVGRNGEIGRIAAVQNPLFLPPPDVLGRSRHVSDLIGSVSDSLLSGETAKYYRVIARGFHEDCRAFVDRLHEWNGLDSQGIPRFLLGGDYVMTFNDDKIRQVQIALELKQPATVYVLMDDRVATPIWLSAEFVDTGWDIGLDAHIVTADQARFRASQLGAEVGPGRSIDSVFSIWQQEVPVAAVVDLGSLCSSELNDVDPYSVKQSMYGVVVQPLQERRIVK